MKKAILLSLALLGASARAQEEVYISVNEAVDVAIQNNSHIKMAESDRKTAYARFRQADAVFLPQIEVTYTALSTNNPLNAFGFLLQHQSVTAADFDPVNLNSPGATQDYAAAVAAKLPLFNLDAVYARKGAKAQEEMYKYKAERTKEFIELETKKAYTQLQFSYHARNILQGSLKDVKQIYESVNNFYTEGLIQKSDVLNAQVQVNTIESALAKAESNIQNASDALRLLMGVTPSNDVYSTDPLAQKKQPSGNEVLSITRSDIMALNKALDANTLMIKSSKLSYLPRINAFGSYQLNDSKPFGFEADSYLIGVQMNWRLFTGNENRNKIKSFQFQQEKLQEELHLHIRQSQLELNKTRRDLSDLQTEIDKHKASVTQADEALRILDDRHKAGLVSTTDLLLSQAQLAQQQLLLAQAIMAYNTTQAYWDFLIETE